MLYAIVLLLATSVYFALSGLTNAGADKMHLPQKAFIDGNPDENLARMESKERRRQPWMPLSKRYKKIIPRLRLPFRLKHRLIKAGSPVGILEFLLFEALAVLSLPVISLILLGDKLAKANIVFISAVIGVLLPVLWLNAKIRKRQHRMRRELPNVIDLLNLCVSGGLDFMLSVQRVVRDLKRSELTEELAEVYRETQMGASRKEALKNFAWRVDMPEVYSFVRTLTQADRMGTPIAEALKIQSDEIRVRRFQRGEAMALKAPIKLLFPLFVFILPVVLVIVTGPIFLDFIRGKYQFSF